MNTQKEKFTTTSPRGATAEGPQSGRRYATIRHTDGTIGIQWHGYRDAKTELEAWLRLTEAICEDNEQTTAPDGTQVFGKRFTRKVRRPT